MSRLFIALKIPDEIALVGFTDEFHSTVVDPTLTSVTHPTLEMGREAARFYESHPSARCGAFTG